jgi:ribonuclease T1
MKRLLPLIALALLVGWVWGQRGSGEGSLPAEAQETLRLIHQGGPFPFERDGIVFNNFEQLLPPQARGYYREYTVPTPDLKHRGARRIVCGGLQPQRPEACWYSADHYKSFRKLAE